ncbi:hypothetical protein G4V62_11205 [Bacillaceae bacterium SIJ1]|uniref:hypothetical protein n=1 Tax=Litoribacterium kuwaitense TaxID=1398745 RepID=UPI0013EE3AC5|nr:hypothetical protein [Litoribacterium kuwaitense]NGP45496.1 hypothetical protein [Litoribacterium kuwaitense]
MNTQSIDFLTPYYKRTTDRSDGRHLLAMQELFTAFELSVDDFDIVQIAGSCGKGSTAHYLSAMLDATDVPHGLFTGPHLEAYEERMQINGVPIPPIALDQILLHMKKHFKQTQSTMLGICT